ncbi:MAG TPA: SH3 domain-containing protein, partial [Thermomicrobiales bacterium]|nr:SH3 domain-containing protein [Thermomicrobiales bacterium]
DNGATTRIQSARSPVAVGAAAPFSSPPGVSETVESGPTRWDRAYALGGKVARRTGRFRGILWRLTLILFIGNLLLGTVLLVRGGPSALVERFLAVAPNTTTTVNIDELNLRVAPDLDAPVITVLDQGDKVRVTGLSETSGPYQFWPVDVTIDGSTVTGWVWGDGLAPNEWTGRLGWVQGIVDQGRDIDHQVNDWTGTVTSLWPF